MNDYLEQQVSSSEREEENKRDKAMLSSYKQSQISAEEDQGSNINRS